MDYHSEFSAACSFCSMGIASLIGCILMLGIGNATPTSLTAYSCSALWSACTAHPKLSPLPTVWPSLTCASAKAQAAIAGQECLTFALKSLGVSRSSPVLSYVLMTSVLVNMCLVFFFYCIAQQVSFNYSTSFINMLKYTIFMALV